MTLCFYYKQVVPDGTDMSENLNCVLYYLTSPYLAGFIFRTSYIVRGIYTSYFVLRNSYLLPVHPLQQLIMYFTIRSYNAMLIGVVVITLQVGYFTAGFFYY